MNYPITMAQMTDMVKQAADFMLKSEIMGLPMREFVSQAPNKGSMLGQLFPIALDRIMCEQYGELFRKEQTTYDKDVVCKLDDQFSFEIKVSTDPKKIRGNKSYVFNGGKKNKSSYYLAVSFDKITFELTMIRFGYLTIEDWHKPKSNAGQGTYVKPEGLVKMDVIYIA